MQSETKILNGGVEFVAESTAASAKKKPNIIDGEFRPENYEEIQTLTELERKTIVSLDLSKLRDTISDDTLRDIITRQFNGIDLTSIKFAEGHKIANVNILRSLLSLQVPGLAKSCLGGVTDNNLTRLLSKTETIIKYTTPTPENETPSSTKPQALKIDPRPIQVARPKTLEELRKLPDNITHLDCSILHKLLTDKNIAEELERFSDNLESLDLTGCSSITSVEFLVSQGFEKIAILNLAKCTRLQNINFLASLPRLKSLDLYQCSGITKDGIKILIENTKSLKEIKLAECGVIAKYIDEIALRFPTLDIIGKDGMPVSRGSVLEKMAEKKAIAEAIAEEKKAIKEKGDYKNKKNDNKMTLREAVDNSDIAKIKELLYGANIDDAMLQLARQRGNGTVLYLLETHSQTITTETKDGGSEKTQSTEPKSDKDRMLESLSSSAGDVKADLLFLRYKNNINAMDGNGDTPLHLALQMLDGADQETRGVTVKLMTKLLEAGADPSIQNPKGDSFIDLALDKKEIPPLVVEQDTQPTQMGHQTLETLTPSPSPMHPDAKLVRQQQVSSEFSH